MKKHLLLSSAVIACAFSSGAYASDLEKRTVVGVSRWGNTVVFGPGYKSPVANTNPWNAVVPGTKHIGNITDVTPKTTSVSVNSVSKSIVLNSVVNVAAKDLFVEVGITNTVTQAALTGAVTGLVTGGPGNAVFMGATSALMAWALSAEGVSANPSFPASQITHPFLKTQDQIDLICIPPQDFLNAFNAWKSGAPYGSTGISEWKKYDGTNCSMGMTYTSFQGVSFSPLYGSFGPTVVPTPIQVPATWSDISADVETKGNILPETLQDALDYGAHPDMQTTVTGPAESKGETKLSTSTVTNPDGSTSTVVKSETDTNRNTYSGNKLEFDNKKVTEITNPDGTKIKDEIVTKPGEDEKPKEPDTPPTDTPLGPVPDLYERKYPDGMEGVWNTYKDQLKNTSLGSLASKLMPNIPDGGTCPQWPLNLDLAQWATYGTHDVAPPCYIWGIAKAILVVSALLLARALIFGG